MSEGNVYFWGDNDYFGENKVYSRGFEDFGVLGICFLVGGVEVSEMASATHVRIDAVGSILKFNIAASLLERILLGFASSCGFRGRC